MFKEERYQYILNELEKAGRVVCKELAVTPNVSEDTVRRDLQELANANKLMKVMGERCQ